MAAVAQRVVHEIGQAALHAERTRLERTDREHGLGRLKTFLHADILPHILPVFNKTFNQGHDVHHGDILALAARDVYGCVHDLLQFSDVLLQRAALTFVELLHAQAHAGKRRAQIVRHRGEGAARREIRGCSSACG